MFPQRNRKFDGVCHKEIVKNRKIEKMISKHHLPNFLEIWLRNKFFWTKIGIVTPCRSSLSFLCQMDEKHRICSALYTPNWKGGGGWRDSKSAKQREDNSIECSLELFPLIKSHRWSLCQLPNEEKWSKDTYFPAPFSYFPSILSELSSCHFRLE